MFYEASTSFTALSPRSTRSKSNSPQRREAPATEVKKQPAAQQQSSSSTSLWISYPFNTLTSFLTPWASRTQPAAAPPSTNDFQPSPTRKAGGAPRNRSPTGDAVVDATHAKKLKVTAAKSGGSKQKEKEKEKVGASPAIERPRRSPRGGATGTSTSGVEETDMEGEKVEQQSGFLASWSQWEKKSPSPAKPDTKEAAAAVAVANEQTPVESTAPIAETPSARCTRGRSTAAPTPSRATPGTGKTAGGRKKLTEVTLEEMHEAMSPATTARKTRTKLKSTVVAAEDEEKQAAEQRRSPSKEKEGKRKQEESNAAVAEGGPTSEGEQHESPTKRAMRRRGGQKANWKKDTRDEVTAEEAVYQLRNRTTSTPPLMSGSRSSSATNSPMVMSNKKTPAAGKKSATSSTASTPAAIQGTAATRAVPASVTITRGGGPSSVMETPNAKKMGEDGQFSAAHRRMLTRSMKKEPRK